jgi:predicted ArsR family transcriptional regulator
VGWFARWRKRRILKPYDDAAVVVRPSATVEQSVAEGLMISEYAVRLRLKNAIAVDAVVSPRAYDPKAYLAEASEAFEELASESQDASDRLTEELARTIGRVGRAQHVHDYRRGDEANVRHRLMVATEAASALRQKAGEEEYLLDLIEQARQDAWHEVSASLVDHALQYTPDAPTPLDPVDRDIELASLRAELEALTSDG